MDRSAAEFTPIHQRVQRASADDIQDGEVWVGDGSAFDSPYRMATAMPPKTRQKRFRSWIHDGPESPYWLADDMEQWSAMILQLSQLTGKVLATDEPLDKPSHADVLADIRPDAGMRPVIVWEYVPA